MELAGLGINQQEYEDTRLILEARSRILEENAFRWVLTGRELAGLGINQQEYEDTRLILEARSRILEENGFR
jgi:hypothetical protein